VLRLCVIFHYRIDDIQDNSILHRGIPVAHTVCGIASTIGAASCLIYTMLEKVLSLNHPEAATVFTKKNVGAASSTSVAGLLV